MSAPEETATYTSPESIIAMSARSASIASAQPSASVAACTHVKKTPSCAPLSVGAAVPAQNSCSPSEVVQMRACGSSAGVLPRYSL